MQQRSSLEEYIESLMYEESLNDLITILSDTIDSLPIGDNIAGYSAGLGGGTSNGGSGSECVGSYPVSGYTRSDGTEVSGYIRTCGAAYAGSSSEGKNNNQQNTDTENDWDYVNPDDLDDVLDRELLEDYYNNRTPLLEGKVEQIRYVQPKAATEIYSRDELTVEENLQKTLTENLPTDAFVIAQDYYTISFDLANNPDAVKDNARNRFYKVENLPDFVNKQIVYDKIEKSLNVDLEDSGVIKNTMVVIPRENSPIVKKLKNAKETKRLIRKYAEELSDENTSIRTSVIYTEGLFDLYGTLKKADIENLHKNKDGSIEFTVVDYYDFEYLNMQSTDKLKIKAANHINNNAFYQQAAKKLKPYVIYIPVKIPKEEADEILIKPR